MSRSRLAQNSRLLGTADLDDPAQVLRVDRHVSRQSIARRHGGSRSTLRSREREEKHQHKITARESARARLDPAQPTSLDKQREISASEATTRGDLVDGSEEDEGSDTGDAHIGGVGDDAKGGVLSGIAAPSASSVAELRERLAERCTSCAPIAAARPGRASARTSTRLRARRRSRRRSARSPLTPACRTAQPARTRRHRRRRRAPPPRAASPMPARWISTSWRAPLGPPGDGSESGSWAMRSCWRRRRSARKARRARRVRTAEGGEDAQIGVWERALEKASGIKQKDDPALLRKTMRQKERQRKKSAQDWKAREKTVADARAREAGHAQEQSRRAQDEKQVEARPCPAGLRRQEAELLQLICPSGLVGARVNDRARARVWRAAITPAALALDCPEAQDQRLRPRKFACGHAIGPSRPAAHEIERVASLNATAARRPSAEGLLYVTRCLSRPQTPRNGVTMRLSAAYGSSPAPWR